MAADTSTKATKAERNEFILDSFARRVPPEDIAKDVYRKFGDYVTPSAIGSVVHRARQVDDVRVRKRRPVNRSFNGGTKPKPPLAAKPEISIEEEPDTATLLLKLPFIGRCKWPLRGEGIGLIVCGAKVTGKGPYCSHCRGLSIDPARKKPK